MTDEMVVSIPVKDWVDMELGSLPIKDWLSQLTERKEAMMPGIHYRMLVMPLGS